MTEKTVKAFDEEFAALWKAKLEQAAEKARSPEWTVADVPWHTLSTAVLRATLEAIADGRVPPELAARIARKALDTASKLSAFPR